LASASPTTCSITSTTAAAAAANNQIFNTNLSMALLRKLK
jgi:hypothetical protein